MDDIKGNKISEESIHEEEPLSEMHQMKMPHNWYIGCIIAHSDDECDILVKCVKRKGQDACTFSWPQREDKCHIPSVLVLCTVPAS
jgi:hypothetical protein